MFKQRPLLATLAAILLCAALVARLISAPPAWWSDPSTQILANPPATPDNYAVANLGQLKHIASMSKKHLDQQLAAIGGAGGAINDLVLCHSWSDGKRGKELAGTKLFPV